MKISILERAMRVFMEGALNPVMESLNGNPVLNGPGLAEFAEAANTLSQRVVPAGADPKPEPLNWA